MQCNQPISFLDKPPFFVSGPPHCQQFFVQQPPLQQRNYAPLFPSYPNPDIVGEGEVTSVIQPDGTIQLFFRPTNRWAQWNSHTGTYFVTSVNYPPSPLNIPVTYPQDNACFLPLPSPAAQFKFHNDQCTSTADIEYFFPRLRSTDITITPTSCAGVQVNSPACKNVVFTGKISRCDADKGCCSSHSDMSIDSDNLSTMSSAKTCCGSCKCSRKTSDSSACSKKTSLKLSSSTSITSLDEEAKKCLLKLKERKKKEIEKQQKLEEKKRDKEFKQRQKELEKHRQRCKKLKQKEQERQKQLEKLKKEYERKLAEAGSSQKCSKQCKNSLDSCDSSELLDSSDTHAKSCSTCCSSASVEEPECVKTLLSKPCEQMKERPCIIERSPMPPSRQQSRRASDSCKDFTLLTQEREQLTSIKKQIAADRKLMKMMDKDLKRRESELKQQEKAFKKQQKVCKKIQKMYESPQKKDSCCGTEKKNTESQTVLCRETFKKIPSHRDCAVYCEGPETCDKEVEPYSTITKFLSRVASWAQFEASCSKDCRRV